MIVKMIAKLSINVPRRKNQVPKSSQELICSQGIQSLVHFAEHHVAVRSCTQHELASRGGSQEQQPLGIER